MTHNIRDPNDTPLMCLAAKTGSLEILKFLVGKGESLNNVDKNGNTAFHYACNGKFVICQEYLLESGIDETLENKLGLNGW